VRFSLRRFNHTLLLQFNETLARKEIRDADKEGCPAPNSFSSASLNNHKDC
jgi:hypothetical protein